MKFKEFLPEEKVRLDPKCWTGKKIGNPKTKVKGGVRVNNCVPAESVNEMDKSQTPPGRDGSNDPDAGKKEYTAKATTPKKVAKHGEKILNKVFNKKQGVAEGEGMLGRSKYDKRYLDKFDPTEVMNISDDPEMKAHRTTRQGSLRTSKKDLEFAFGPSGEDDTWVLEFRNGLIATVYPNPNSNIGMDWFIGGNHPDIEDYVLKAYSAAINDLEEGVAEGSLNEGQYEMMMRNGQVKKFIAKDDADAKRIAAGHGAKSVIKLRGGVPAGKVAEQGMAEAIPATEIDPKATQQYAQQIIQALQKATGATVKDFANQDGTVKIVINPDPDDRTYPPSRGYIVPTGNDGATMQNITKAINPYYNTFRQKGWRFDQPVGGAFTIGIPTQQAVAENYNPEYDDEAGMADNNLETLDRAVEGIDRLIQSGDNLPEWCQEKIAVAKSMLVAVWDYMYSEEASDEVDPEVDEMFEAMDQLAEEMAVKNRVSKDLVWEQFEALPDHVLYETAAWRRKEGKSKKGGLNAKGVASYRRENPGSKLQMAVTTKPSKLKKGSKAAKRRKSFCARMGGVKGPMKKPNGKPTRKALALRKWNC